MKNYFMLLVIALWIQSYYNQSDFKYFRQVPPGSIAELFAPGVISLDDRNEAMITFSPDGKECYFTVSKKPWNDVEIMETVFRDTSWTTPTKALFIKSFGACPSISSDGNEFFFIGPYKKGVGVNQCSRTTDGYWSAPVQMDSLINSESSVYGCYPSSLGSMYICSWRPDGAGGCDGWRIPFKDGQYLKAENMGALNS